MTGIINYIHMQQWDVAKHACPNFNNGLIELPLQLGQGLVITNHINNMVTYPCPNLS